MTNSHLICTRYEDDLKAYIDGELSWLRRLAVRRHLTHCLSCQKEIIEMTQIAEDLRSAQPEEALPSALREKILSPLAPNSGVTGTEGIGVYSHKSGSPRIGGRGASLPLKLGIAGAMLVAWCFLFPAFQKVRETARSPHSVTGSASFRMTSPTAPVPIQKSASSAPPAATDSAAPQVETAQSDVEDPLRQVHKEASIGVQVPNPEVTGDAIQTMVNETGGYVATNTLTTGDDGLKSANLIVKVPVNQFETFLAQVAKLGNVQSKNISGEDITEKTSDAAQTEQVLEDDVQQSEARLKALGAKAKWTDQQTTRDLRIQRAQARARLVLLKRMAALGTITIDLSQTPKAIIPPPVTGGFTTGLTATTHDALLSLFGSAGVLLSLIIWLLAYAPVWIPMLLIGRYALKRYEQSQEKARP